MASSFLNVGVAGQARVRELGAPGSCWRSAAWRAVRGTAEVTDAACFLGLLDDPAAIRRCSGLPGSLTGTS